MKWLRQATDAATAATALLLAAHCGNDAPIDQGSGVADVGNIPAQSDAGGTISGDAQPLSCPPPSTQTSTGCMPPSSAGGDGGESAATEPDAGSDDAAPDAALVYDGGPFACGTMTCAVDQYCTDHSIVFPGIDAAGPPDTYFCLPMYVACQQDPTCACITSSIASGNPCSRSRPARRARATVRAT